MTGSPEFHSGNWTGFYLESHRPEPGWMHLYLTCDGEGLIRGEGIDYVGPWSLAGTWDRKSQRCQWVKSYVGKHRVEYRGMLGADGIDGSWRIEPFLSGRFRIWPEYRSDLTDAFLHAKFSDGVESPRTVFEELQPSRAM